ncbi:sushi, von Willebrand factor type A, EGF and pentraxin domain-containing protein 1-like [Mya arenaria]|uniref:sushi, von Willebrand factor type A, EGF and pentraxin domain-containing protein 1-like n=1 Tax=Mya arenaria TaxID=6604 RepID=UPI0022E035F2|nr:sushi, von Willebrand factor type A, EGF and pentraxin domain-containing protein 1-like [Mya arenaria]
MECSNCEFTITVESVSCDPPLLNVGEKPMVYNCPTLYTVGSTCNIWCKSGYPRAGTDTLICDFDLNGDANWEWDGFKPFCQETNCTDLDPPLNGAMACSPWSHGQTCQMQCNEAWDVPYSHAGFFVCSLNDGLWTPLSSLPVPDCSRSFQPNRMRLPNEYFYYSNNCIDSEEARQEIKENFTAALNTSLYRAVCVNVPECDAKYVNVTCGPTSTRRKRNDHAIVKKNVKHAYDIAKRQTNEDAYVVGFEISIPFDKASGQSDEERFVEIEDVMYKIHGVFEGESDSGHFDIEGLTTDEFSLGVGIGEYECPTGMRSTAMAASCSGCAAGHYMMLETRICQNCPYGTYQNESGRVDCIACPANTNTTETGTRLVEDCLDKCPPGHFSSTGLTPCAPCPLGFYQAAEYTTSCIAYYDVKVSNDKPFAATFAESTLMFTTLSRGRLDIDFTGNNGDWNIIASATTDHSDGRWHQVAVTFSGGAVEVFVNGEAVVPATDMGTSRTSMFEVGDVIAFHGVVDGCGNSSCGSDHTCVDRTSGFECVRIYGYMGPQCKVVPDFCSSHQCQNGATCVNGQRNYTCVCQLGMTGILCDVVAVNGAWSLWTPWNSCTKSCDGGTKSRTRACSSPPPDPTGQPCTGAVSETQPCAEEKCPYQASSGEMYGHMKTRLVQAICVVTSRPGFHSMTEIPPYYECGRGSNYTWSHQISETNTRARLPSCIKGDPPSTVETTLQYGYTGIPCNDATGMEVTSQVTSVVSSLQCLLESTCTAHVQHGCTGANRKKRSTDSMTIVIVLTSLLQYDGSGFNVDEMVDINGTAPSSDLVLFLRTVALLENTTQFLYNETETLFSVTLDGVSYVPDVSSVSADSSVRAAPLDTTLSALRPQKEHIRTDSRSFRVQWASTRTRQARPPVNRVLMEHLPWNSDLQNSQIAQFLL